MELSAVVCKKLHYFYQTKPDVLFSTGGIIALPTCLAAYLMNIPIHFYELNVIPGKAIKTLAPIAQKYTVHLIRLHLTI